MMNSRHRWRLKGIAWLGLISILILNTVALRKRPTSLSQRFQQYSRIRMEFDKNPTPHSKPSKNTGTSSASEEDVIEPTEEPYIPNYSSEEGVPEKKLQGKRAAETSQKHLHLYADIMTTTKTQQGRAAQKKPETHKPKYVCDASNRLARRKNNGVEIFKQRKPPFDNHGVLTPLLNVIKLVANAAADNTKPKTQNFPKLLQATTAELIAEQEAAAEKYLERIEEPMSRLCNDDTVAVFEADTSKVAANETDVEGEESGENPAAAVEEEDPFFDFQRNVSKIIGKEFTLWPQFTNPLLKKEIRLLLKEGQGTMSDKDFDRWNALKTKLDDQFKKSYICEYKSKNCDCKKKINCDFKLDPEITEIFERSKDPAELEYYFTAWHDAVGSRVKAKDYEELIKLSNVYAKGNGFPDNVAMWADSYNEYTKDWTPAKFKDMILSLWDEIRPYYKILHAYVRMKFSEFRPYASLIKRCGYIPVHFLGNMFGQSWVNVGNITKPYPNSPSLDATEAMRKKKYTPKKMLEIADAFFQSLGLKKLPKAFWEKSVYVKPKGVESSCHPSAYDMCLGRFGEDYRISMCAVVSQKDFATMHHELGHIQYMMQYAHQRYAFRTPPNPGFDESIGDVLAMSVTTPEHLQCSLGLDLGVKLDCGKGKSANKKYPVTETDINYLYMTALESLAFFPFSIAMDAFRWLIMEGKVQAKDFNAKWWEIRKDLQGVIPPKPRPANVFDPAAKYHTVVHVSYMSYFVSTVLQFDFYEALCKAAGQFDPTDPNGKPLYKCDFTGSKKAGKLFANMLKKGNKTPWPKALRALTGRSCITTQPMLNYFKPLFEKLKQLLKEGHQDDCLTKEWM